MAYIKNDLREKSSKLGRGGVLHEKIHGVTRRSTAERSAARKVCCVLAFVSAVAEAALCPIVEATNRFLFSARGRTTVATKWQQHRCNWDAVSRSAIGKREREAKS